jgi:hypothetical protein
MQMTTTQREDRGRKGRKEEEQTRRRKRDGGELTGRRLGVAMSMLDFDNFAYRWVNDSPARIFAKTKEDDWDVVMNDNVKDDSADIGNAVSQVVGSKADGSPLLAYLCRKPKTYFDEDQNEKSRELDAQLAAMRSGKDRAGGNQSDYVPNTGINLA